MSEQPSSEDQGTGLKPLRTWIPLLMLLMMVVARYVPSAVQDGPAMLWMLAAFGPLLLCLGIVLWWLTLSRATWGERLLGLFAIVGLGAATVATVDPSMHGPAMMILTIPMGVGAFAIALCVMSRVRSTRRTWVAIVFALLGFGFSTLLQAGGMRGDFSMELDWRWNSTPEQRFLASRQANSSSTELTMEDAVALADPQWPGFRGPQRDGVQRGSLIDARWDANPPQEQWRIQVGPAWSSFAVAEPLLMTQEQRGELEAVVCYDARSGQEVWARTVESRFFDPLGGPGPRATPTLSGDSVFALGAEGWLQRIDALSGQLVWSQDLREMAERDPPMWGFSSSPLVVGELVVVHAGGEGDKGVLALDRETGQLVWSVAAGADSYGSPQIVEIAGQSLIGLLSNQGAHLWDAEGQLKLEYLWEHSGYRVCQSQVIPDLGILIPTGMGRGTRLVKIDAAEDGTLSAEEVWTSRDIKPDFNDLVVHQGHAYGFDGAIFACVNLEDGRRTWKRGRYGKGQVLLLADSDLLLVVSEEGELVLLKADPSSHQELARLEAFPDKTWNHPVVVGDRLYVRNAVEAVCYQLPLMGHSDPVNADPVDADSQPAL